jgi:hypothetical protein
MRRDRWVISVFDRASLLSDVAWLETALSCELSMGIERWRRASTLIDHSAFQGWSPPDDPSALDELLHWSLSKL